MALCPFAFLTACATILQCHMHAHDRYITLPTDEERIVLKAISDANAAHTLAQDFLRAANLARKDTCIIDGEGVPEPDAEWLQKAFEAAAFVELEASRLTLEAIGQFDKLEKHRYFYKIGPEIQKWNADRRAQTR